MQRFGGICGFGPGAMVEGDDGWIPVNWLEAGTPLRCREMGMQPIAAIVRLSYSAKDLMEWPEASPVRVRAQSLGAGLPVNDLLLAPGQKLMRPQPHAPWTEAAPVIAARAGLPAPEGRADYTLIALPMPDMILVEGLWMRSVPLSALQAMQDRAA